MRFAALGQNKIRPSSAEPDGAVNGELRVRPDHPFIQMPTNVLAYVGGLGIVIMMLHIVFDVAGRETIGIPIDGTTEVVSFYNMVVVTFLPLAYVSHHEGHITVELFTRGLSRRRLAALEAIVGIFCLAFVIVFVTETWIAAEESRDTNEMWETSDDLITIWPSRYMLPLGAGLMAVYMVIRIFDDIRTATGRNPEEAGSAS